MESRGPQDNLPDRFDRVLGLAALFCLAVSVVFMAVSWRLSTTKLEQRRAYRERLFHIQEHEWVPMPRWHLDRG